MLTPEKNADQRIAYYVGDSDQPMTEEQARARIGELRQHVTSGMVAMRDRWVSYRAQSGVEARWRRARELYLGKDMSESALVDTLKNGPSQRTAVAQAVRSQVVVNIVRPKADQAVARMCEILLPIDDRNWGIRPTPVPSSVTQMIGNQSPTVGPDGADTGLTAHEEAMAMIATVKEATSDMERVIDDSLNECGYNGEQRKGIVDAVLLGPMVMVGPYLTTRVTRSWRPAGDGTSELVSKREVVPASQRVDPWDIFFDPACGNDHQRGQGYWRRRFVTRKEIRALAGVPGFDTDEIREVLRQSPNRLTIAEGRVLRSATLEGSYEMWEYHGEVDPAEMSLCSINTGDPLEDVDFGVVLMINDRVVGAMPSWVADRSLNVDVWCWRDSDTDPYGYGLPWEMEHQQSVVTAAWRQVMDNAKVTSGGQIVMKRKKVKPADGNGSIYPNKLWYAEDDVEDVRDAFTVFNFNSHIDELLKIATSAMQFADLETSMPTMQAGDKSAVPETVGGMVMQFNQTSTVLRMRVKTYDDRMTRPHISRHYDWHMANNQGLAVKCDCEIDARGSTSLLEKDIQNQTTMNLAAVTSNPRYGQYLDPKKELALLLRAFKVQPEDIMLSAEQIKHNEQNPPEAPVDPRVQAAQIMAQVKQAELQDGQQDRALKAQTLAEQMGIKREQIAYNQQREQGEYDLATQQMALDRDVALAKLATQSETTQATLASKERLETLNIDTKRQLFNAESALRVSTGQGI